MKKHDTKAGIVREEDTEWIDSNQDLKRMLEFVSANADSDVNALYLKLAKIPETDRRLLHHAIDQILARKKYHRKFSEFLTEKTFIFPSVLAAEQATHQDVAKYHTILFGKGSRILDMTAGLGVDALTAARYNIVIACELDPTKAAALRHNAEALGISSAKNVGSLSVMNSDSMKYLGQTTDGFDIIFADPARRSEGNARVFNPADCLPDVVTANSLLLSKAGRVIVKHSPMLDITMATRLFPHLKAIHIVCQRGELKEVLTEQKRDYEGDTEIVCVDIRNYKDVTSFSFPLSDVDNSNISYIDDLGLKGDKSLCGKYVCIPNAAIMKTGAWNILQAQFPGLLKLDVNSHVFLSETYPEGLPGRIFEINGVIDKKEKGRLKGSHYNVIVRNYPIDAESLSKSLKVIPGGDNYLIATRIKGKPLILKCTLSTKSL